MTTFNQLSEQILFGDTLADKLVDLSQATDLSPGKVTAAVTFPGRPSFLLPDLSKHRVEFPKPAKLAEPKRRGEVFHFFANHELLALELMALFLLRFPAAPKALRAGLVATMQEEQDHLRSYLEQMAILGVSFGEVPVNRFFWDHISQMTSPLFFLAAMGLTFEQANLDYAAFFRDCFAGHQDHGAAKVMADVLADEMRHVGFGLAWFQKLRPRLSGLWQEYRNTLTFPLTPSRAKGLSFNPLLRQGLGFDQEYLRELTLHCQTKGRPPVAYGFDPTVELRLAGGKGLPESSKLAADLAPLVGLMAKPGDVVLVPREPSLEFREQWCQAGLPPVEYAAWQPGSLATRSVERLEPWSRRPEFLENMLATGMKPRIATKVVPGQLFSKSYWTKQGLVNFAELWTSLDPIRDRDFSDQGLVFKAPFGVSGRGQMHKPEGVPLSEPQRGWLKNILEVQGEVLVEPRHQRLMDLSVQGYIGGESQCQLHDALVGLYDRRGRFWGHFLQGVDPSPYQQNVKDSAMGVAKHLMGIDFQGPFGIDAYVFQSERGAQLRSLVEVNPRYTMGHLAQCLRRKLAPARLGLWLVLGVKDLQLFSCSDFADWGQTYSTRHPLQYNAQKITEGFLPLTELSATAAFGAVLVVGEAARDVLNQIADRFEDRVKGIEF